MLDNRLLLMHDNSNIKNNIEVNESLITYLFTERYKDACIFGLGKYCSFINALRTGKYNGKVQRHPHHILPKSIFPDFKDNRSNIIMLRYVDHKKAHLILAKAVPSCREMQYVVDQERSWFMGDYESFTHDDFMAVSEPDVLTEIRYVLEWLKKQGFTLPPKQVRGIVRLIKQSHGYWL